MIFLTLQFCESKKKKKINLTVVKNFKLKKLKTIMCNC
mgnify:CR=1 FL=1